MLVSKGGPAVASVRIGQNFINPDLGIGDGGEYSNQGYRCGDVLHIFLFELFVFYTHQKSVSITFQGFATIL